MCGRACAFTYPFHRCSPFTVNHLKTIFANTLMVTIFCLVFPFWERKFFSWFFAPVKFSPIFSVHQEPMCYFKLVLRIWIRYPVLFWPLDPIWKKIRNKHPWPYFQELSKNYLGWKSLSSFLRIWDPVPLWSGSGIRCLFFPDPGSNAFDPDPGSDTGTFLTRIRDPLPFWPGFGIRFLLDPDPGSGMEKLWSGPGSATLIISCWRKFKIMSSLFRSDVAGVWSCVCREGWDGKDCATRLETQCADGLDNDAGQHAPPPPPVPIRPYPSRSVSTEDQISNRPQS